MKRLLCSLILVLLAAPAFAGTVYVPYAKDIMLGGATYETQIWISNGNRAESSTIEYLYIPTFRDGTDREQIEPIELIVTPGDTFILAVEGDRGMLEIFAPEEVQVHARMVPIDGDAVGQGFGMPIATSDNVVPAGENAHLLGWERFHDGETTYTNFGLLNLGHQEANCLVDVIRINGTTAVEGLPLTVNALSHNMWGNALGILGVSDASGWRAIVTCDQQFFTYASVNYPESGRMTFVGPAASGKSELSRPTDGGVSDEFDYLSDLPIDRWGGIELRPFINRTGIDWHPSGGGSPVGGVSSIKINGVPYEKGLSFYPKWSSTGFVEYKLNGEYALFTAVVRVADYYRGKYEWAVVSGGRWIRLERPPEGFNGPERTNPIRVGSALTFQVLGDGQTLLQSPEIYAYGDAVILEIDVTGVDTLRLQTHPGGHERRGAPHRNGLSADRYAGNCPWLDMVVFADPKVYKTR